MARKPYRLARQEHLADALDDLNNRGQLTWRWDYDDEGHRAVYNVQLTGEERKSLDTKSAESLVLRLYTTLEIPWRAIPHPGGEEQRGPVVAWIKRERELRGL